LLLLKNMAAFCYLCWVAQMWWTGLTKEPYGKRNRLKVLAYSCQKFTLTVKYTSGENALNSCQPHRTQNKNTFQNTTHFQSTKAHLIPSSISNAQTHSTPPQQNTRQRTLTACCRLVVPLSRSLHHATTYLCGGTSFSTARLPSPPDQPHRTHSPLSLLSPKF
jgi:hypothetical protein